MLPACCRVLNDEIRLKICTGAGWLDCLRSMGCLPWIHPSIFMILVNYLSWISLSILLITVKGVLSTCVWEPSDKALHIFHLEITKDSGFLTYCSQVKLKRSIIVLLWLQLNFSSTKNTPLKLLSPEKYWPKRICTAQFYSNLQVNKFVVMCHIQVN